MSKTTSAVSGATSGAMSGAMMGSVVPGVGTAIGAVVGGVAGLVGGYLSGSAADDQRAKAEQAANEAFNMIASMDLSPDESKALIIEKLKQAGVYTPKMEENLAKLPDSHFEQIKADPKIKQAQAEALQTMQKTGRVGLGPQERAALAEAQDQEAREAKGRAAGLQQQMQARGIGGSGAELAAQLSGQQAEANTGSLAALKAGSMASQAALEGARSSGSLAGQIGQQEYQQAANLAGAQDATTRFNTENQIQSQRRNIENQNVAQQRNLQEQQRIQDVNAATANQEQARQSQARRQKWQDDMNRTLALSNARMGQATQGFAQAAGTDQGFADTMSGISKGASAYATYSKANPSKSGGDVLSDSTTDAGNTRGSKSGSQMSSYAEGGVVGDADLFNDSLAADTVRADAGWGKVTVKGAEGGLLLDKVEHGGLLQGKQGGVVPGKAEVPGNSYQNDTVHALLSPGEVVIPRHVMHGEKPGERAKKFINAMMDLHELKKK